MGTYHKVDTMNLNEQCQTILESAVQIALESGDDAAAKFFYETTETWPIFAVSELGQEINKAIQIKKGKQ